MHHYRKKVKVYSAHRKVDELKGHCTFCTDKGMPGRAVEMTQTMYVVPNRTQYDMFEGLRVKNHLMIVPRRHVESISDMTPEEKLDMMNVIGTYEARGYSVYARSVDSASRSVKHQHTHLLKLANTHARFVLYMQKPYFLLDR